MGGGAVHNDAGLVFRRTAFAEFCPVRGEIQTFHGKEFVVLRTGHRDIPIVCCRNRAAADQCVGAASDLVDADCRPDSRSGVRADIEAAREIVEAVVALSHDAHALVGCEILIFDGGIHVVADIVVAAGAREGNVLVYGDGSTDAHGMNVGVARGAHLRAPRVDRSSAAVRCHLRRRVLIDAVDCDARSTGHLAIDRNVSHGAHGVDLALGIRRDVDGRMRVRITRVDVRVVQ